MIVETLHLEIMLVLCSVIMIFFTTIWSVNGLANVMAKLFLIGMSFWVNANTIVIIWFS